MVDAVLVPKTFRTTAPAFVNMSFTEAVTNTGYIKFYLSSTWSGSQKYIMIPYVVACNATANSSNYLSGDTTTLVATKVIDKDFDILCNVPIDLLGKAVFRFTMQNFAHTAGKTGTNYVIIKLRKWDGASETEIANSQGDNNTINGTNGNPCINVIDITVPLTHFKKNEYIRVTVEAWSSSADNVTQVGADIGIDPENSAITVGGTSGLPTSKFEFFCPIRING